MTRLSNRDRRMLGKGGQRLQQERHKAELYERKGEKLDRSTGGGMSTRVRSIWSSGMKLTDAQRSVGNHFGHCFESINSGGGSEFLREQVDGGGSGGGYNERMVETASKVRIAGDAMAKLRSFKYPLGKSRNGGFVGLHKPINYGSLVILICVDGLSLYQVGWMHGWTSQHGGKVVVPDRQRNRISAEFGVALDAISDAWSDAGLKVPASNVTVK